MDEFEEIFKNLEFEMEKLNIKNVNSFKRAHKNYNNFVKKYTTVDENGFKMFTIPNDEISARKYFKLRDKLIDATNKLKN